ncbi:serine protease FAM111A-like [Poeciliopsis prolifica]|uniref:serine protease FAM111A-like n=1 Tax=Poeciliopsis prolifica TaxID=188132 RepID=UPI0024142CA3|nr:serine protease FAM111A-like [Poeciliopsis prolifica]
MKTSAKRKRTINKTDNKSDCDKENVGPDEVSSPLKKKRSIQHQTDSSGNQRHRWLQVSAGQSWNTSSEPGVKKTERMTEEKVLKRDLNAQRSDKSPESISPPRNRVDMYFSTKYKAHSPTNKPEQNDVESESEKIGLKADEPPGHCKLEAPNPSYKEFLSLMKEIEVSVCKISVHDVSQGTCFVVCDNIILTNAHLFRDCMVEGKLLDGIKVSLAFELETVNLSYTVEKIFLDIQKEPDYAFLKLIPEDPTAEKVKFPPGLLKRLGPVPKSGKVWIIGFPAGREKTTRCTIIVEEGSREDAVKDHLAQYNGLCFTQNSVKQIIIDQGIGDIMKNGIIEKEVVTYRCPMRSGTSGSPVIDEHGLVIGLHTGGYDYGFPRFKIGVIEFAWSCSTIFKMFVSNLRERGEKELLERIRQEVLDNDYATRLLFGPESEHAPLIMVKKGFVV